MKKSLIILFVFIVGCQNVSEEYDKFIMEGQKILITGEWHGEYKVASREFALTRFENLVYDFGYNTDERDYKIKKFFGGLLGKDIDEKHTLLYVYEKGSYFNGRKHGKYFYYDHKNDILYKENYKYGSQNGLEVIEYGKYSVQPGTFFENIFKKGVIVSHKVVFDNGDVEQGDGEYASGNSTYTNFLSKSVTEFSYRDGQRNGPFTTKFANGDIERGTYQDGKKSGDYFYQFSNGTSEKGFYSSNGRRIKYSNFE